MCHGFCRGRGGGAGEEEEGRGRSGGGTGGGEGGGERGGMEEGGGTGGGEGGGEGGGGGGEGGGALRRNRRRKIFYYLTYFAIIHFYIYTSFSVNYFDNICFIWGIQMCLFWDCTLFMSGGGCGNHQRKKCKNNISLAM